MNILGSCVSFQIKVQILAFYTDVCMAPKRLVDNWKPYFFKIFYFLLLLYNFFSAFTRVKLFFLSSCSSTRDHIGRSTRNSSLVMTSSAGGTKGCSDHRFHASPAYTAQLLTLHQHRANNQYRMANQM